jgi:hypothetical protein
MTDFELDVGLSYLPADEPVAMRLAEAIGDRVTVGTAGDGARLCVALYREPWGESEPTRAAAEEMKARGLERGWDFLLVVPLDAASGRRAPVWAPRANVWLDLDRYGLEGAAAVIEQKVRELGGQPRSESAREREERLQRQADAERERDAFLSSEEGVEAAQRELAAMFAAFKSETDAMRWSKTPPDIYAECRQRQCAMRTSSAGLAVLWQLSYGNSLHRSELRARVYSRPVHLDGQYRGGEKDPVAEEVFSFTRTLDGRLGWVSRDQLGRVWSTDQFVQQLLKRLLDYSHEVRAADDVARETPPAPAPLRPERTRPESERRA